MKNKITFRLTEEQIYKALKSRGIFRTQGLRAVLQTVLLSVVGVGFFISYFGYDDPGGLLLGIVSFAVVAAIWLVPWFGIRSRAKCAVQDHDVTVSLEAESLVIGQGSGQWEFPLDQTGFFWQTEDLILLETQFGRMTVLPKEVFEAEQLTEWLHVFHQTTIPERPALKKRKSS